MGLLILADDLTGALDSGVQLAKAGIKTLITYEPSYDILKKESDVQVLVIDMESRHIPKEQAYQKVYDLASQAESHGFPLIYKKADSTLRGNIGSELAALLDATGASRLFFAPAYPKLKRTTVNGIQLVDGTPVAETVYAKDPLDPVEKSSLADVIGEQTEIPVIAVSKERLVRLMSNKEVLPQRSIVAIDAETDRDLMEISHILAANKVPFLAGSAGLSATLPDFIGLRELKREYPLSPQRVLVLCGSLNACSLKQVQQTSKEGVPLIVLGQEQLQKDYVFSPNGKQFVNRLSQIFGTNDCVILQTGSAPASFSGYLQTARWIGQMAAEVIEKTAPDLVVIFGGDTLLGVSQELPNAVIVPQCEILSGVVQSRLSWDSGSVGLVSKAGGFGDKNTLTDILRHYGHLCERVQNIG